MKLNRSILELIPCALLGLAFALAPAANANQLDPALMCRAGTGTYAVNVIVCTAAISSGKYSEHGLSALHVGRARALRYQKKCSDALADTELAIKATPWLASAWNEQGMIHHCLGDQRRAIANYVKALELSPTDQQVWRNQGIALYFEGKFQESIASLDRSIELNPVNPEALAFRGLAYHGLGDVQNAGWSMLASDEFRFSWNLLSVWRAITIASADGDPNPYIARQIEKLDDHEWPRPLLELLSGDRSVADIIANRSSMPVSAGVVDFYLAEKARIDGNLPEAQRLLALATQQIQDVSRVELILAKRLLNGLNQ